MKATIACKLKTSFRRALMLSRNGAALVYGKLSLRRWRAARAAMADRLNATPSLDALSREGFGAAPSAIPRYRRVLVDGMWDNPNYFLRFAMLRSALGLAEAQETGLLGRHRKVEVSASFELLGIRDHLSFYDLIKPRKHLAEAHRILSGVATADDLSRLRLPYDYPSLLFYDGLLRRQRRGAADPQHPLLAEHLAELLACLHAAERLMRDNRFDLVVLSHALNFDFSSIAWAALRYSCRVIVLYGSFGTARFNKLESERDFFDYTNRPTRAEMDFFPASFRARLRERGGKYLDRRYRGGSGDLGAAFAYVRADARIDRDGICRQFGFDPDRPLIAVYASNWFDFPHSCAMEHFRDFQDWIEATARIAAEVKEVNWLFKPHPADDWYPSAKGPTLAKIVAEINAPNVQLTDTRWTALDFMHAIDGAITYHGTIGIELSALGKPVLVADRGFYGDCGFVLKPASRQDYLDTLRRPWWRDRDPNAGAERAREFAGWYFCSPDWQDSFVLADDSEQDRIYPTLPQFLGDHREEIAREIALIRDWETSPSRFFHTYKIAREAADWDRSDTSMAAL